MNLQITLALGQDGLSNGAIYALLALAILLVFTVTRVLLIPQGEFVSCAALTMAAMQDGKSPISVGWLLLGLALIALGMEGGKNWRQRKIHWHYSAESIVMALYALVMLLALRWLEVRALSIGVQAFLTIALIAPLGPLLYRIFFQPIAKAHSLVLLIVSIAVHVILVGVILLMFGPEGAQTKPFSDRVFEFDSLRLRGQILWVIAVFLALIVALSLFFGKSLYGKALRASAIDRFGAELVGISLTQAGKISFALAAFIGAVSGILIAPVTTLYFDSGFAIGLKGFAAAIIGGLASYPLAGLGALLIGQVEAFSTFWASSYKEALIFVLLLPVLLWLSLARRGLEEE